MAELPLPNIKGSETEKNLNYALGGESRAYIKYLWYSDRAKKDGYFELSNIYRETADNEKEHAEMWFKYLGGFGTTEENLRDSAGGEHYEWESMYSEFARVARNEGFNQIADLFDRIASVEKRHEERYNKFLSEISAQNSFTSDSSETLWICLNCGFVVKAKDAPKSCPACAHPQGYFKKYNPDTE